MSCATLTAADWPATGCIAPRSIQVDVRPGLPSLTVSRNGRGMADRWTSAIVDHMRYALREPLPSARVTVAIHDDGLANTADLALWIRRALDAAAA